MTNVIFEPEITFRPAGQLFLIATANVIDLSVPTSGHIWFTSGVLGTLIYSPLAVYVNLFCCKNCRSWDRQKADPVPQLPLGQLLIAQCVIFLGSQRLQYNRCHSFRVFYQTMAEAGVGNSVSSVGGRPLSVNR